MCLDDVIIFLFRVPLKLSAPQLFANVPAPDSSPHPPAKSLLDILYDNFMRDLRLRKAVKLYTEHMSIVVNIQHHLPNSLIIYSVSEKRMANYGQWSPPPPQGGSHTPQSPVLHSKQDLFQRLFTQISFVFVEG
jgi:hypothetical protein